MEDLVPSGDQNLILIDWVSITSKSHTFDTMAHLIGLRDVEWTSGKSPYYDARAYWQSISIHYNRPHGVWLEMSGQGCRTFETASHGDFEFLFGLVDEYSDDMMLTRLDIAFDDHTGVLDLNRIFADTISQSYVSKARSWLAEIGSSGTCVYIGSKQSPVLIRIYDKAAERKLEGEHWVRVELQLRDERCMEFVKLARRTGIQSAFASVLLNYLRFVDGSETEDSNIRRWPIAQYWSDLVGDAVPQSIFVMPGIEYNVERCENYVYHQAGNAIAALLEVYDNDIDTFLAKLQGRGTIPNPKYQVMIQNAMLSRQDGGDPDEGST